jgi:predicted RND superfamily exporter protein
MYLRRLHWYFLKIQKYALRYPRKTLFFFLLQFLIFSFGIKDLQFLLSIDDLIESDFSTYQSLKKVNQEFKDKNTILLSIESDRIFSKQFLCDIQDWIRDTARQRHDLIQIQSTFGIRQASIEGTHFELESHLNIDCFSSDPEVDKIKTGFAKVQKSPWQSILTTPHGYTLTINFIVFDPEDKKYGSVNTAIVGELQKDFNTSFLPNSDLKTYWGGITTYQSHLRKAFDQTQILNGLMFILSLIIFRVFLGSWKAGHIYNGTVIFTLCIVYGIMGFCQIPVDVLTNSTGLMIVISCLEDFVFIVFGMVKFNWSLRKSIRKFVLASFFTSLTTAIGFGSLITSDLNIIRRFGLISAIGTLYEWACVFFALLAFVKIFPKVGDLKFEPLLLVPKDPFAKKIPRPTSWALIALVTGSMFFWHRLIVKDSPNDFFFSDHTINQTSAHFLKTRGWVNELSLLFANDVSVKRKTQVIQEVEQNPLVHTIEYSEYVKSYINANTLSRDHYFVNYLWESSSHAQRLIAENGTERAQIFINDMSNEGLQSLKSSIQNICQNECHVVGSLISYNEFSVRVLETLFSSLGVSLILVVFIILSLGHRLNKKELWACIISSIWGPLALLGLFIIFKVPLFFVSCICASVLIGLAGDNAIQFIFFSQKGKMNNSVDSLTQASLIVSIGMMVLSSVFLLSSLAPLAKLGLYILLGFILGYLGDLWVLRGLLQQKEPHS